MSYLQNTKKLQTQRPPCDDVDDSYQHCFPSSWDNGDTEKMSPWDMEPIPEDGKSLEYAHSTVRTHSNSFFLYKFKYNT